MKALSRRRKLVGRTTAPRSVFHHSAFPIPHSIARSRGRGISSRFLLARKRASEYALALKKSTAPQGAKMKNMQATVTNKTMRTKLLNAALAAATLIAIVCTVACGGVQGTYTDTTGAISLVLKSGGNATFTFAGQTGDCTYTSSGSTIALTCPGQAGAVNFTLGSDGTLTGPPDSFFPPMKKK
jgi:hypothetical protein